MKVQEIERLTLAVSRELFWDPCVGLGFLRGRKLQDFLAKEIGDRFEDVESPLRISTFDIASRKTKVYSEGPMARVVRASCSVPLMFHPVKIGGRLYWTAVSATRWASTESRMTKTSCATTWKAAIVTLTLDLNCGGTKPKSAIAKAD